MKYRILVNFTFAHEGYRVVEHKAGDIVEVDEPDFDRIVTEEAWAEPAKDDEAPTAKPVKATKTGKK